MSKCTRTLLALASAAIMLSALASAASANHLSTSTRTARATWTAMEFIEPFGQTVRCPVTLEGTLHSATISKTPELLVGFITRATVGTNSCSGGSATVLQETLPWHLRYAGFTGTLPNMTAVIINTIGSAFRVRGPFGTCLFTSTTTQPTRGTYSLNTSHAVTGVAVSGTITSNEGCGPFGERITGSLRGNSATNTAQTITLI